MSNELATHPHVIDRPKTSDPTQETSSAAPTNWHALASSEIVTILATHADKGLPSQQVLERQACYGRNRLAEIPPARVWKRLLGQFGELIVWILVAAALIAAALGEWLDASAILSIVAMNGVLGFLQEGSTRTGCFCANAPLIPPPLLETAKPGDLIELETGDHVPADARLIETFSFAVQESALTGESVPTSKEALTVLPDKTTLADRRNMAYLGTVAVSGRAMAVVVATGMETELGQIAGLLERQPLEPTPLQKRLRDSDESCWPFVSRSSQSSLRFKYYVAASCWKSFLLP